jgi:serine-type D-Ala-D-Ala carboxypeptidase
MTGSSDSTGNMSGSARNISSFLCSEIDRGAFPGAQYLIGEAGEIVAEDAVGRAVIDPEMIETELTTIYDLASLTKPLVTSLLAVMMYERGILELEAPIGRYLRELNQKADLEVRQRFESLARITLKQLLTHTSGLVNWLPLYLEADDAAGVTTAIAVNGLEASNVIDAQVEYSDLGYILVGFALERVTHRSLDELARQEIFEPLELSRTMFNPPRALTREIAATEHGQLFERKNAFEAERVRRTAGRVNGTRLGTGTSVTQRNAIAASGCAQPWRTGVIWGEVHDGNAHFLGGVAGHAGLFSTAREAFLIGNQFLPGGKLLGPESLRLFAENLTGGGGTDRSIGFVLASTGDCSAGPCLPPTAFGHTGFTGTSLWIDPDRRRVFVLLTNRVHPRVRSIDMKESRQRFHSAAIKALDASDSQ